jgi:hypothetical protein
MKIAHGTEGVRLDLAPAEERLLRHALERALFIDTPPAEQEAIAGFAARLLDALAAGRTPGPA